LFASLGGLISFFSIGVTFVTPVIAMIFFYILAGIIQDSNKTVLIDQLLASLAKFGKLIAKANEVRTVHGHSYNPSYSEQRLILIKE